MGCSLQKKKGKGVCFPCLYVVCHCSAIDVYYKQKLRKKEEYLIWTAIRTEKNLG
jgi:hypothetical protein